MHSTARALFEVFVRPAASLSARTARTATATAPRGRPAIDALRIEGRTNITKQRSFGTTRALCAGPPAKPKSNIVDPFKDAAHPLNEAIDAKTVHFIDDAGQFNRDVSLKDILKNLDKTQNAARLMNLDANGTPIVKIVSVRAMRLEYQTRMANTTRKTVEDLSKEIELSWGITSNDLSHRLKKLEEFLQQGRRVDVLIAPKRGGRKVEPDEMQDLVRQIYDTTDDIGGVEEWKDMEGQLGGQVMLHFRLRQDLVSKVRGDNSMAALRSKREEKMKKKEEDKRRRKEELEARAKRKQDRQSSS